MASTTHQELSMKRHALAILAAAVLPLAPAFADEADGSQYYRSGMTTMPMQWAPAATDLSAMPTAAMGAQRAGLTRAEVRAQAVQAVRDDTTTRGEKGGFPH
jgi:hypothetical protein